MQVTTSELFERIGRLTVENGILAAQLQAQIEENARLTAELAKAEGAPKPALALAEPPAEGHAVAGEHDCFTASCPSFSNLTDNGAGKAKARP